ncbi:MAG TPA: hypothetical protein VEG24_07710 [Gaiellaceae bacterium]|nr:hypothetical protein [Gaiellaceae bacterium]
MRTTTHTHGRRRRTGILLAAVAGAVLLAAGVQSASAAPAASFTPTNTCWKDVVNDWLAHQPNVRGLYPIPCYTQAIQHLSLYPDVQQYSSAMDDIHRALLAALLDERGGGLGGGTSSGGSSPSGGTSSGGSSGGSSSGGSSSSGGGPIGSVIDHFAPSNAQTVPLPLLVLGGLALLLMFAALATWITRRIQGRRMTPAPAPATSPRQPPRKPR